VAIQLSVKEQKAILFVYDRVKFNNPELDSLFAKIKDQIWP
jgi:hypothetical protein